MGETPRLIDEWQLAPIIWDAIRYTVDHRNGMGQFILTGSAKPANREKISHSGTGRFAGYGCVRWHYLNLEILLGILVCQNYSVIPECLLDEAKSDLQRIAFLICRGGWPVVFRII